MLLDRGALVQEGAVYRPTGTIESLEVPETLHALIAARLDGLPPAERRVVQDAVRARQDVHEGGARLAVGSVGVRARADPLLARPQGGLRRCRPTPARPSTASTASSRTCCARSPTRRWRRPTGRRGTSPPRRSSSSRSSSRRSSRSSRPTTSPRTRRRRTRRTPPRSRRRRARSWRAPASGRRRSARTRRPSATSPRPPGSPRIRLPRLSSRSGPAGCAWRGRPRRAGAGVPRPGVRPSSRPKG